ncbi:sulfite exporter TauE/SafE family protein [Helicobacter mehlei]|nr:sulfite exporter TauE/SafE family protein [Helicobacter mehlei]
MESKGYAMEMAQLGLFLLLGLLTGVMAGFFGIGGGMVIVPTLLLAGYSYDGAVGISVVQMACSSVVGSWSNFKKGLLDWKVGIYVGLGGLIGASFSGLILSVVPHKVLLGIFIAITIYSFWRFLFIKPSSQVSFKTLEPNSKDKGILIGIGVLTGIFAISLGIGGGVLMVSMLSYYFGLSPKQSVPLGLFFVVFSSFSGVLSLMQQDFLGPANLQGGVIVGIGSILGVMGGVRLMPLVSNAWHRRCLLGVYALSILVSIYKLF